ncbi:hypothetical protein A2U01_0114931, partial [Trifolium medium]|nr:hypothetical protein [Trifolium medium]
MDIPKIPDPTQIPSSRRLTGEESPDDEASNMGSGYLPVGKDLVQENGSPVPKGHLAVYVGQK